MTKSNKKLYFFTASFPYGLGEMWKANELAVFINYFKEITVIPYSYAGNYDKPKKIPQGVKLEKPLFEKDGITINKWSIFKLFDKNFFYYLEEFFAQKAYSDKQKLTKWLIDSIKLKNLLNHPFIKNLLAKPDKDSILYFYWGRGSCDFIPFTDKKAWHKIVVRMHRYDLFEDENKYYIPYRRQLFNAATTLAPTSQQGHDHIKELYPRLQSEVGVFRCGTIGDGISPSSQDHVLRIVTCSLLSPVKRVHLVIQALKQLKMPVEWTHLGDGVLRKELEAMAKDGMPTNVKVNFAGMIESTLILKYFREHTIDVFINVSSSEGVPFSIMEAFSAEIPVFATRVGGTGEIVDDTVGKILPADVTPDYLAEHLTKFYEFSTEKKIQIRKNAYNRYIEMCDAKKLANDFAQFLIS